MTDCIGNTVPKGWQRCVLPDFTYIVMGQSPSSKTYNRSGDGLPFFQGKAEFGDLYPTINQYCSQPKKIAKQGATLLSVRAPVGPTNLAQHDCCIGRGLAAFHPCDGIAPKFLLYLFRSIEPEMSDKGTGSTFNAITKGFVENLEFNLPPIQEQRRIVTKIEELFSELDKGIESLKAARAQLNVYRQAVLKQAFEGKLTAQWREENKDQLETPEQLLDRIKQEREARYEQQLKEWKAAVKKWEEVGRSEKKPAKPKKVNLLPPLTETELVELPRVSDGWGWVRLGNLDVDISDGPFGSNLKGSDYVGNGIRVIRLENIGDLEFHNEKASYITMKKYKTISKHTVTAGDVIVSSFVANGTRAVVLPDYIERAVNKADCFCIRCYGSNLENSYIAMFLVTRCASRQLGAQVHGATRPRINTTQLKKCAVPLISRKEQEQMVPELEKKLSLIAQLETCIETHIQKAATLRLSVFKKAFEGKLVPQDPNDEPAWVLLDRIRSDREQVSMNNHPKKTRKRKATA